MTRFQAWQTWSMSRPWRFDNIIFGIDYFFYDCLYCITVFIYGVLLRHHHRDAS
jgi:hypothetical protein